MTVGRSLMRTGLFALAYVLATVAGRQTVMDGTNLSMVWPAAGVLVVWFCAQRHARARWADVAALVAITVTVNLATGASGRLTVVFLLANLAQIGLFLWLFRCWQPALWIADGRQELTRLRDLWLLLGAATASTGVGAAIGTTGLWLINGHFAWSSGAVWLARNTASVLLIGAVGLRISYAWHNRPTRWAWHDAGRWARTALRASSGLRVAEYTALIGCSALAYWLAFAVVQGLPVAFLLIAVTVWAGLRMPTTFVVCHDLVVGAVAVLFTLYGSGTFAAIGDHATRALVAQVFVGMVAVIGLALALGRDERRTLMAQLVAEKEEAAQSAALNRAIIDSMADGLAVIDAEGHVLLRNEAAARMLGGRTGPGDQLTDTGFYGLFHPDGSPMADHESAYARIIAGEGHAVHEMLIRNPDVPDGQIVTATGTRLDDQHGGVRAVLLLHDITTERRHRDELRQAHDALQAQQAYLTQVLDAIDVTVITCDTSGTIVHANRTARGALPDGPDAHTVATATPRIGLTHPDGVPVAVEDTPLMRALRGEHVDGMEAEIALPDGSTKAVLLHARPLTDTTGQLIGAVAASYNVTALREREADLQAFAGVAAHDLKAPLAAVAGYAEILDDELPADTSATVRSMLARITGGVDRMRRLIDDLLSYATARDAALNLQPVDLNAIVADVIAERTAHLRTHGSDGRPVLFPDIYTGPLPTVHADTAMIRQLLDNLIGNALKYTLPGQPARIDISAHRRPGDSHHRIVIADRGIGIPDNEKPHVFASFRRAGNHGNRPGTGLGLAICQRIVDRHHGTITAADNPGGGTRIHFTLPTTDQTAITAASEPTPAAVQSSRGPGR
ncbi:ATP-binding protein [Actinoplanes sp. NPDC049802]|uniref:ATP-binding protein n=1 Tax=Actinoplanes sp. NPDC049802 TaxID=3154742 RepID=UPI0033D3DE93